MFITQKMQNQQLLHRIQYFQPTSVKHFIVLNT